MLNPYQNMPEKSFWRTAVSDRRKDEVYTHVWEPKFNISKQDHIISAGSCFAQRVGEWFLDHGFGYHVTKLDDQYNFSFATGNIYTPLMLVQWLEACLSGEDMDYCVQECDGRFYDLLRPMIAKEGFSTLEKLLAFRRETVEEIKDQISKADVFIFTLGLTEAWLDHTGHSFANCPGTIQGVYDASKVKFINFNTDDLMADMTRALKVLKKINPAIKLLLTVSPVPLTATASGGHVLPATVYSKSCLRAIAGRLAAENDWIDYFPSYEILSSHASKGPFFEENERTVAKAGVSFVMQHFKERIYRSDAVDTAESESESESESNNAHDSNRLTDSAVTKKFNSEDELCDDLLLDQWNKSSVKPDQPQLILIGDSHMAKLSESLLSKNISFAGGMVMKGADWGNEAFALDDEDLMIPLHSRISRQLWSDIVDQIQGAKGQDSPPKIITNIGLNTRLTVNQLADWLNTTGKAKTLNAEVIVEFIREKKMNFLQLMQKIIATGLPVLVVSDPPLQRFYDETENKHQEGLVDLYEKIYGEVIKSFGAEFLSVRDWFERDALFSVEICSPDILADGGRDWMHGSKHYYDILADELLKG